MNLITPLFKSFIPFHWLVEDAMSISCSMIIPNRVVWCCMPSVIMVGWENIIFIDKFPNKPSIYRGCSFAIFDYQGVTWQWNVTHSSMRNLPRFRFTTWDFRVEIVMLMYFPFSDRPVHIIYLIYIFHHIP